jgi:hypothetical protein
MLPVAISCSLETPCGPKAPTASRHKAGQSARSTWDKDSVYFVSNTPLNGSQYLRGRAFYDRFYNVLDAFDDATYSTMKKPSSFTSIYDDHTDGASVEYGTALPARQTLRVAGHIKEDIHQEHNVGEPIRHFDNRTLSAGAEDTVQLASVVSLVVGIGVDHQTTVQAENFVNGVASDFAGAVRILQRQRQGLVRGAIGAGSGDGRRERVRIRTISCMPDIPNRDVS